MIFQAGSKANQVSRGQQTSQLRVADDHQGPKSAPLPELIDDYLKLFPDDWSSAMGFVDHQQPAPPIGEFILQYRVQPCPGFAETLRRGHAQ